MAKVPVDQFHGEMQHGSFSTPSADLQSSDSCRVPGATDIKRLLKAKAAHQQRVKVVRARVQLLNAHEQQVWKDVKLLHQRGNNQAEFAQWQREVRKEEQLQLQRDVADYHEALKERARHVRASLQNTQAPRLEKYRENKMTAQQVREDSRRLLAALQEVREQSHQSKMMQVEVRKQQRKQQQLRKQVEATRQEQLRQDWNAMRYAQLQEEMQQAEQDLAAIEQEEMAALSRLQRSQSVRESVVSQYQVAPSHPAMGDITATSMRTDALEEPPKQLVNERIEEVTELAEVTEVEVPRDDLKDTLDTDQRAAPRSHQSSGSHGFGPLDSEPEEMVSQEPKQQCDETLVAPVEAAGDETQPKKREGVRPKQPRGYGFSPKKRAAAAAAGASVKPPAD